MSSKVERALYGPSWTEVILGALLSIILGVVLGALYLVLKPVAKVKELPKETASGVVYYLEGSRDSTKARGVGDKQKAFLAGRPVAFTEDELNAMFASSAPAAKPGEKAEPASEFKGSGAFVPGAPDFRIRAGQFQLAVPLRVSVFGFTDIVPLQARGSFAKQGDRFAFVPTEIYAGSCPVQNVPGLRGYVMKKLTFVDALPEDQRTAWGKLADVSVDGATLKLTP